MRRRVHQHRFESNITNATMSTTSQPSGERIVLRSFLYFGAISCSLLFLGLASHPATGNDLAREINHSIETATALLGFFICLGSLAISARHRA
jgi:hypothetical protein